MRPRQWRMLLAAGMAAAAVAVGVAAAIPASADPIDGMKARIMAQSSDGIGYCLTQTGGLRASCHDPADLFTFEVERCDPEPVCYRIRTPSGECLAHYPLKDEVIEHESCIKSPYQVWYINRLTKPSNSFRIRPVSRYWNCMIYDPNRLRERPYVLVDTCSRHPAAQKAFSLLKASA